MSKRRDDGPGVPPRPRKAVPIWPFVLGAVVVVAAGAAFFRLTAEREPPVFDGSEAPLAEGEPPDVSPLPPAATTDAELRNSFSDSQALELLLGADDLLRRYVAAINAVADGNSPRLPLAFLGPKGAFEVTRRNGRTAVAPESYGRYDAVAQAIGALHVDKLAVRYEELLPLLERAQREIGPPDRTFAQSLGQAVGHLLAAPVPTGPVLLEPAGATYLFADPRLESLSPAQKQLLRFGPRNMRTVQGKLRELAGALHLRVAARH